MDVTVVFCPTGDRASCEITADDTFGDLKLKLRGSLWDDEAQEPNRELLYYLQRQGCRVPLPDDALRVSESELAAAYEILVDLKPVQVHGPVNSALGSAVMSLALSPCGSLCAVGLSDGRLCVWDLENSACLRVVSCGVKSVLGIAWSSASCVCVSGLRVSIFCRHTWALQRTLQSSHSTYTCVAAHHAAPAVLLGEQDGSIRACCPDADTPMLLATVSHGVSRLCASPCTRWLSVSCISGTVVHLLELPGGRVAHSLVGHCGEVLAHAFSSCSKLLVTGGADNDVLLWDVASGTCLHRLHGSEEVMDMAFSPCTRWVLAACGSSILQWDTSSGKLLRSFGRMAHWLNCLVVSACSQWVIYGGKGKTLVVQGLGSCDDPSPATDDGPNRKKQRFCESLPLA